MNPREEALNQLIKNDNGYGVHSVHPSVLKIDFFKGLQERMELGIAYLNRKIRKKYIPFEIKDKLGNIKELISVGILKPEEFLVDIMGVKNEEYSKYLWFSDGIHRTITVLSTLKTKERYFDETAATPLKDLRKRVKMRYKQKPKANQKKTKWKKNEFGISSLNGEPAKLPPFPKLDTDLEKNE